MTIAGLPALNANARGGAYCGPEVVDMTVMHAKIKITPWDDPDFVRAFEAAREKCLQEGCADGPASASRVEHLLREAGYPRARVEVDRTVAEALKQVSHWTVSRDG